MRRSNSFAISSSSCAEGGKESSELIFGRILEWSLQLELFRAERGDDLDVGFWLLSAAFLDCGLSIRIEIRCQSV